MERNLNDKSCRLYGTPYCAILNQKSCESCYVSKIDHDNQHKAAKDILYTADVLPEDGLESIIHSGRCALCRVNSKEGEQPNEATQYAQMDMGHLHPRAGAGYKLGNYNRGTALTIPVQLPVCDSCRRRITRITYLPLALGCLIALIGLGLVSLEPVRTVLTAKSRALPFLVFLIFVFLGVIVEWLVKRALLINNEYMVNTRPRNIAALAPLLEMGWFPIGEMSNGMPFVFTKKRLDSGIMTGDDQKELLNKIREADEAGADALKPNREE